MRTFPTILTVLLFTTLALPASALAQNDPDYSRHFEVNQVYPYLSITSAQLAEAQTLADLNPRYQPSWVRAYYSVEISTSQEGKIRRVASKDDLLSPAQKDLMRQADTGTDIAVQVRYLPENTLVQNEAKEMNFTFTIDPDRAASYPSGPTKLNEYLRENAIDKIPPGTFTGYDLAAITFTINTEGEIGEVAVFESSEDEAVDTLLLQVIRNMPCWKPATYADGTSVAQEFVLTTGNMENCIVPLLSIRRD